MATRVINTKNRAIEFTLNGTGIPILFVHGGHSNYNETLLCWEKKIM